MGMMGKIRSMHFRQGKSISEIARLTSLSRNTIKKWLKAPQGAEPKYRRREMPTKLAPFVEALHQALKADGHRPRRERRTARALHVELQALGYEGGYTRLTDYIRAWRDEQGKVGATSAFVPLSFELGDAFQFDWSEEGLVIGGIYRRLQLAHLKLCASRAFWLVAYPTQGHEMLFDAHTRSFSAIGGIPRRGIYDNMKTAVDKVKKGKGRVADIAHSNKALLYGLLFDIAAETLLTIAADPKRLGAKIGATLVLHTWGSALTHHPHVHGIVPGGGLSADGKHWVACRPGFFLPVRVLSRLFRRRFLEELVQLHALGQLRFFGEHAGLADAAAFKTWLAPLRKTEWVVYAKRPFAGPEAVLAYLSRYTHRVAISNRRLVSLDENGVSFRWKDYRAKDQTRHKTMTLSPQEFMRRFLLHVLPARFHRIRHYGLLANGNRRTNLALARELLQVAPPASDAAATAEQEEPTPTFVCRHCGQGLIVLQVFQRDCSIRAPPTP